MTYDSPLRSAEVDYPDGSWWPVMIAIVPSNMSDVDMMLMMFETVELVVCLD